MGAHVLLCGAGSGANQEHIGLAYWVVGHQVPSVAGSLLKRDRELLVC